MVFCRCYFSAIRNKHCFLLWSALVLLLVACTKKQEEQRPLFTAVDASKSGITFNNLVTESETFNITTYEYLYNGGGVAAGDVNNDGLTDLYFTGNMVPNKLYLNKGGLQFEDITEKAGAAGRSRWKTGVNMVDINADGLLDMYVCYSGPGSDADRANQLFINNGVANGVPSFTENAKEYGLDAPGTFTTQCAFFDMDRDGDLDAFMVNHADMFYNVFYNTTQLRRQRHPQFGNRLYRNDNGHFTEVSDAAGISGSSINFGLGAAIGDVNEDHWPDIYVTNDYNEQDFLYLNQQNGTFKEVLQQTMGHISQFSMGADMSDLNNDGRTDIVTLDMLPEDNYRQKLLKGPEGYDYYQLMADSGYHHQHMRNMLQLNMGLTDNGLPQFSEIGQLAGISNTDWSWSPLVADLDNDGFKDLYITNGYLRDFTSMDFLKYSFAEAQSAAKSSGDTLFAWQAIKNLKGTKISNYAFRNDGSLQFENKAEQWGLQVPSISTGAATADLDNDGDLDLIVNNSNDLAMLFENNKQQQAVAHYLQVHLQGSDKNTAAIGATVSLWAGGQMQQQSMYPARGFQSASQPVLHIGLGAATVVDSMHIDWPNGHRTAAYSIKADTSIQFSEANTVPYNKVAPYSAALFAAVPNHAGLNYVHRTDGFVDFKRQLTLPHQVSMQGPYMAAADVNGDGLEDVFIGGHDQRAAQLFLQTKNGSFVLAPAQPWVQTRVPDGGVCFFDADTDGDMDLYVARHGMQLNEGDGAYQHQLYTNNGKGMFTAVEALPDMRVSATTVVAADYNKDGKMDLLVGCRSVPGRYPVVPTTYLLRNVSEGGNLKFDYAREQQESLLRQPGLVTTALWADVNKDSWPDLLLAGEYMPITLLLNKNGQLTNALQASGMEKTNGWWSKLSAADLDNDGDIDLVAGNAGLNMQMKATATEPVSMYYNDYDKNGIIDPFLTYYIKGKQVPALGLDDAAEQTPALKKKMLRYEQYASAAWSDLFDADASKGALQHDAFEMRSGWFENDGKGKFTQHVLPLELQFSTVQALAITDVNADGKPDIIAAGNYYPWRTQWGEMDACYGWVLVNKGKTFEVQYPAQTGLWLGGDVRDLLLLKTNSYSTLIASRYNASLLVRSWKKP